MRTPIAVGSLWFLFFLPSLGAQTGRNALRFDEMNSVAIAALDPARTLLILPVDPLEEHGPHLPAGTDVIYTKAQTDRMISRLLDSLPQWNVVLLPALSYGVGRCAPAFILIGHRTT